MSVHGWLYVFNLFGTFVFAISGALAGMKKDMDIFGMLVLAIVTGSGGGMLRSIAIGAYPLPFLTDPNYLFAAIIATILVFYGKHYFETYRKALAVFDAFGLAIFLSTGTSIALGYGLTLWASVLLGVITAAFGGVMRDMLSAQVPLIFRKDLYATAALAGGLVYAALFKLGAPGVYVVVASSLTVFVIRGLALKYKISLPKHAG